MHSSRRIGDGRPRPSPSRSVPRSDWTTSATRFTESKLVGCARECPSQNDRVCGRSADGGPLARATLKRPADRGSFTRTRVNKTCRSRIFHSGQSEKTCRSRIFHSDKSEKTCRSRIFHSDQSEKTCRSRIFPSGRGEETCRSRNFTTSRIPQQTFVLVLDRASTVTTSIPRFRPWQASRIAQIISRRSLLHSSRRVRGGRFCTRVAESVTVGHVVSKLLGSPVGLDDVRDPIHRVKTGRVCEGMPRSKRSGVRPIGRWRTFGSGHAEETCRSRIFHSDQSEKTCRIEDLSLDKSEKTCRSRTFHSDKSEKTCRSRIFHSDKSERPGRSRIFHSDQSEKTCRSRIFPSGRGEETCRSRNSPTSPNPSTNFRSRLGTVPAL